MAMSRARAEMVGGVVAGAIVLPFAAYVSVVVVGTILGGVGWSVAGKPGSLIGSFGGAAVSCGALVFLAVTVGRALGRRLSAR